MSKKLFRNRMARNPRNVLIVCMAVSDIFLCLVSMPLTMMELLHNYWPMGSGQVRAITYFIFIKPCDIYT